MSEKTPREFAAEVALAAQRKIGDKRRRVLEELGRKLEATARRHGFKDPNRFLAQFQGAAGESPAPKPAAPANAALDWSPAAEALATERGLNRDDVAAFLGTGSGFEGRITKADVEAYLELHAAE